MCIRDSYSAIPNRSFDRKTGTSMATPQVTGAAALMMQWGIVNGNDYYLYGERLKYFLILGAKKNRKDIIYPSPSWGYGELCLRDSFNILAQTLGIGFRDIDIENRQNSNFDVDPSNVGVKYDTTSEDNVFLLVEVTGDVYKRQM